MTRLLLAAAAALALAFASPVLARDCHGDCANCPHRAEADKGAKADAAAKEAPPCGCHAKDGKGCTCEKGCKCAHCGQKAPGKDPKAPAKT
jgi:hypothetical protein